MKRLEGVRLEVDSRRHTVAALGAKIEGQRARLPQTRSKGEFQMEQTIRKMQHKENKLAGARARAHHTPRSASASMQCKENELAGARAPARAARPPTCLSSTPRHVDWQHVAPSMRAGDASGARHMHRLGRTGGRASPGEAAER
jgi:hypothetical protein